MKVSDSSRSARLFEISAELASNVALQGSKGFRLVSQARILRRGTFTSNVNDAEIYPTVPPTCGPQASFPEMAEKSVLSRI